MVFNTRFDPGSNLNSLRNKTTKNNSGAFNLVFSNKNEALEEPENTVPEINTNTKISSFSNNIDIEQISP